jgi:hypothetical protein
MRIKSIKPAFALACLVLLFWGCESEDTETHPFIIMKTGTGLIIDGAYVSPGGSMKFGISATGGGGAITDLVVTRISDGVPLTELDRGMFIRTGGLDTTLTFIRGYGTNEMWKFFIMNSARDTASVSINVYKGSGSAYGEINFYPSITLGYQGNAVYSQFLDIHTGVAYSSAAVAGNESMIDLVMLWHVNGYPTLSCPGYNATQQYYPLLASWSVRNITTYDYYTSDNNLITMAQFDAAENDSLLTTGYRPALVSGFSKYAYTGKVVPFKTADGKYGLIKVIEAGENNDGTAEIAIKIQK